MTVRKKWRLKGAMQRCKGHGGRLLQWGFDLCILPDVDQACRTTSPSCLLRWFPSVYCKAKHRVQSFATVWGGDLEQLPWT